MPATTLSNVLLNSCFTTLALCSLCLFFPNYRGNTPATKGKAFVVYEDIFDARVALEKLNGYNVGGRYLVLTYHKPSKVTKEGENSAATARAAVQKSREEVQAIKDKYGV